MAGWRDFLPPPFNRASPPTSGGWRGLPGVVGLCWKWVAGTPTPVVSHMADPNDDGIRYVRSVEWIDGPEEEEFVIAYLSNRRRRQWRM